MTISALATAGGTLVLASATFAYDAIYLTMSVRKVGSGIGVLDAWRIEVSPI